MPASERSTENHRAKEFALEAGLPRKAVESVFGSERSPSREMRINDALDLLRQIASEMPDKRLADVATIACEQAKSDLLDVVATRGAGRVR
jgi:hypothetical protein